MTTTEIIAGTLKWCNDRRAEKGMKALKDLPKGFRGDGHTCPCGKACKLYVGHARYWENVLGPSKGELPMVVKEFVCLFDDGDLPQYEYGK